MQQNNFYPLPPENDGWNNQPPNSGFTPSNTTSVKQVKNRSIILYRALISTITLLATLAISITLSIMFDNQFHQDSNIGGLENISSSQNSDNQKEPEEESEETPKPKNENNQQNDIGELLNQAEPETPQAEATPPPQEPEPEPEPKPKPEEIEETNNIVNNPVEPESREDHVDKQYPYISQEIKNLAKSLGLTYKAKKIFYDHNPQIYDRTDADGYDCNVESDSSTTIIYGCWEVDNIYILRTSSMETTVAHELLHAIYYNLFLDGETSLLDEHLRDFKLDNPHKTQEILDLYTDHYDYENEDLRQWAEYNELHSFIATQFDNIPQELEDHYAEYFKNREEVLYFYERWQESFRQKSEEIEKIADYVRQQDEEYVRCAQNWDNTLEYCQAFQADRDSYNTYGECLESHQTLFHECLKIRPEFLTYKGV